MSKTELQVIRSVELFSKMPEDTITALRGIALYETHPAKTMLVAEGDPNADMYVACAGKVKIGRTSMSGREQIMTIIAPGQHFNIVPVFDGRPCPANAETMMASQVLRFPGGQLRQLVSQHPALALTLLGECCGHMRRLVNLVDDLTLHTVYGRLARLLAHAATDAQQTPLTQADMAAQLGTVREMVGRSLKALEAQGLIEVQRGVIRVLDPAGLLAQADG